jgi:hypothetical protein
MRKIIKTFCIGFLLLVGSSFARDLVIDKNGNEIPCRIISVDAARVVVEQDSTAPTRRTTIKVRDVFMIKYENGEKRVFRESLNVLPGPPSMNSRISCAILANGGTFGLFNVNNTFTKASYSVGFTPLIEYRINPTFTVGVECLTLWGKPETSDSPRLLIDPSLRASALFSVTSKLCINPIIGLGFSMWPKQTGKASLDSTFLNSRFGWNARAALSFEYRAAAHLAIALEIGYSASSSESDNVWITHDMMLVGIGPKFFF